MSKPIEISHIQAMFNRSIAHCFSYKKNLWTFGLLFLCGIFTVFCRSVAMDVGEWLAMSFAFFPLFFTAACFLSFGVVSIRIYYDERKKREISFSKVINKSWERMGTAAYFSLPLVLLYLVLWMGLGFFFLLKEIPMVGEFFSIILAFAPFLLNLALILLSILLFPLLFFLTPILALRETNRWDLSKIFIKRFTKDPFSSLFLMGLGLLPMLIIFLVLFVAASMTQSMYSTSFGIIQLAIQWIVMLVPFTALFAPTLVFFFNFSAESHSLMQKLFEEGE